LAVLHLWSLTITASKVKSIPGDAKDAERQNLIAENTEATFSSGRMLSSQFYIDDKFLKFFGRIESIIINK
jgi:hypothetical protein